MLALWRKGFDIFQIQSLFDSVLHLVFTGAHYRAIQVTNDTKSQMFKAEEDAADHVF